MTLYADLGVAPDADAAAIKCAHRSGTRKHHPDNGGDRESFERIQRAYLVLRDPAKRRRYDATGEADDQPNNELSELTEIIVSAFRQAIGRLGTKYKQADVIAHTRALIDAQKDECRQAIVHAKAEAKSQKDLLKRLGFKGKGPDLIRSACEQHLRQCEDAVRANEAGIAKLDRALAYLADCSFDFDKPEPPAKTFMFLSGVGGASTCA